MSYKLFKPTYRDRDGIQREAAKLYVEFADHLNGTHRWPLDKSPAVAKHHADNILALVEARRIGEAPDDKVSKWLDTIPNGLRQKLTETGIIDPVHAARELPLAVHIDGQTDAAGKLTLPGFKQHLLTGSKGDRREDYAETRAGRVRRTFAACGLTYWRDLSAPGVATRIHGYLAKLRAGEVDGGKRINGQTYNNFTREIRAFCRWMVADKRATSNPLADLKGVGDKDSDARVRRELSVEELRWLVAITEKAGGWEGFTGDDRAAVYRFAYETALRTGALRALTVGVFKLDGDTPHVVIPARFQKNGKAKLHPIRTGSVTWLLERFRSRTPTAPAFTMPDKFNCANMLRADLCRGAVRLDRSRRRRRQGTGAPAPI